MNKYREYILALKKCAAEHDNDDTPLGLIRISDLCRATAELLEKIEQKSTSRDAIKTVQQEPCEDCCNGDQIEKAKLCQKSYLAGMKHKQELCEDAISRQAVLAIAGDSCLDLDSYEDTREFCDEIKALLPVTPQPETGYISIDDVMSVFDDFMCGEVDEEGTDTFLMMLKDRAESMTKDEAKELIAQSVKSDVENVRRLPSVTPQEPIKAVLGDIQTKIQE